MLWEFRKRPADFLLAPRGVRGRKGKAVGDESERMLCSATPELVFKGTMSAATA